MKAAWRQNPPDQPRQQSGVDLTQGKCSCKSIWCLTAGFHLVISGHWQYRSSERLNPRSRTLTDFDVGPELPTLPTKRLRLRWLKKEDVAALLAVFGDREVIRYWSHPPFSTMAEAEALLGRIHDSFHKRTLFQWGLELATTGGIIGTCTLAALNADHRRAELGYALGRPYWGQGYMAEALPVLLRFAFERLRLHRLTADVDPRNGPSIRSLERLGFQREGYLREHYLVNGETQDGVLFGLLRSEVGWIDAGG
jgi:[ribosomal protein S5]-alanine N-acetyltransferase